MAAVTIIERWLMWEGMRYRVWERPVAGSGTPPLVLIHGYAASVEQWGRFIRDIGPDVPVYALDSIGSRRADKPANAPYGREFFVGQLEHLRASYGWGRVVAIGHSAGALLGLTWVADRPDAVAAVIAIAPGSLYQDAHVSAFVRRALAALARPTGVRLLYPFITRLPYRLLAAAAYKDHAADPATRRAIVAAMRAPEAMWSYTAPFRLPESHRVVARHLAVRCPVHVIRGGQGRVVSAREAARWTAFVLQTTLTVLDSGGHAIHEERSREVAAEIRTLLGMDGLLPLVPSPFAEMG